MAKKSAASDASVLMLGESGTGKSVLARQIHQWSPRTNEPFVTVNCPSLSRELFESELFGHMKGSFTGAVTTTWGKVAAADRGTLFLDEIGELPLEIQPKLLRLLQEREYERVGDRRFAWLTCASLLRRIEISRRRLRRELSARICSIVWMSFHSIYRPCANGQGIFFHRGKPVAAACRAYRKLGEGLLRSGAGSDETLFMPGNIRELRNVD